MFVRERRIVQNSRSGASNACMDGGGAVQKISYVLRENTSGRDISTLIERDTGIRVAAQLVLLGGSAAAPFIYTLF